MLSRYYKIIDGCNVSDIALNESGYNYYLFVRPGSEGLILRENTAGDEYRFSMIQNPDKTEATISAAWAARASQNYKRPSEFKAL